MAATWHALVRIGVLLLLALGLTACPASVADRYPPLSGQVRLPAARGVQATTTEVGTAATVSLIDPATNVTLATTLTRDDTTFTLIIKGFTPKQQPYYLEAIKGLGGNQAGNDAVRLRTLVYWDGVAWSALTAGDASINAATTAIAAIVNLQAFAANLLPPLMNRLTLDAQAPSGYAFASAESGIDDADYQTVAALVSQVLTEGRDPLAQIRHNGTGYVRIAPVSLAFVSGVMPDPAIAGATLSLYGGNFDSVPGANIVDLNGAVLPIQSGTLTRLEVLLPQDATSGTLTVGHATVSLTVMPPVGGQILPLPTPSWPPSGSGTDVKGTLLGRYHLQGVQP